MKKLSKNLASKIHGTAKRAVSYYTQGILTVEALSELIAQEWMALYVEEHGEEWKDDEEKEIQPPPETLWRIAQRLCSTALYNALRSSNEDMQERATENIKHIIMHTLRVSGFTKTLRIYNNATEDAVNRTLQGVYKLRAHEQTLRDPAALLGWIQVIVHRKGQAVLEEYEQEAQHLSLELEMNYSPEQFVDTSSQDPVVHVLDEEQREALRYRLSNMRNKRYMQVLIYDYLEDLDDTEIAQRMGVDKKKVQMWRHRGLRWLREHWKNG